MRGRTLAALATAFAGLAIGAGGTAAAQAAPLPADLAQLPLPQLSFAGAVQNEDLGTPHSGWEGRPIAERCDLDGDGVHDLVIGGHGYDSGQGRVFATRGGPGLAGGVVTGLAETVRIDGFGDTKGFGTWTECAGDFDGDGFDDVLISSDGRGSGQDVPVVYVVLGGAGFFGRGAIDVAAADAPAVSIQAPAGLMLDDGSAVPVRDVDGDGKDDLAFTLPWAGKVYVVHGRSGTSATTPIDPTDPSQARELLSGAVGYPTTLTAVGDLDGDGFDELVIANSNAADYGGRIEVISGALLADGSEPSFDLSNEAAGERLLFRISGLPKSSAGFAIADVPDLHGDGRDELAIGSRWNYGDQTGDPPRREAAGQVHVVFGTAAHDPIDLANLGSGGYVLTGPAEHARFGSAIAVAPDLDGDGLADLVIGAPEAQSPAMAPGSYAGRAYVIYGKADTDPIDTADLGAEQGAFLDGTHYMNKLGLNVASVGDVDGDGVADLAFAGWAKNFTGKGEVRVLRLGEPEKEPDPDPNPPPVPTPESAPLPAPPGPPAPQAGKPNVKRLGKRLAVDRKGIARVARVSCPAGGGPCSVKAPKRVRVTIGAKVHWVKVLAPKRLGAGKAAVVRVKLGAAALKRLGGRKLAVAVPLRVSTG